MDINLNNKIKNAIDFYMLINNLKSVTKDNNQSIADEIYGSMVLATAINSEYKKVDNLGLTIRIILLGIAQEYYEDILLDTLAKMKNGDIYIKNISSYYDFESFNNKNSKFAFDCVMIELSMTYFFDKFLIEENIQSCNIEELYNIAKNYGFIDKFGNDDKKNFEIFRFYYLNRALKQKVRSGWDQNHWNITKERIERISEHVVGTIALALAFNSEFNSNIDLDNVVSTLSIHEIGEIEIGDITPFDDITPEQKKKIEHEAMKNTIGNLSNKKEMLNKLFDFDDLKDSNDKFAYYCDKLEADIQAKVYQEGGYQHTLTDQENNVVFKSSKVQKIVEDGAKTAFDIWYEYDKPIYENDEVFSNILKYVRDNNIVMDILNKYDSGSIIRENPKILSNMNKETSN